MPTKDKSQFALINRIRGKTSYFAHLTGQQDLNNGKINRIQSNGGSGSIISEYGAGSASFTENEIKILLPAYTPIITLTNPPTKPILLINNYLSYYEIIISWVGGTGATSYIYTINGIEATPSSSTSQSATFSSGISANTSYTIVVTAINAGGRTSSDPFNIITQESITINGNYGESLYTNIFILKYLADGTPQWAKAVGGTENNQPVSMVSDSAGNLYVSGYYDSTTLNIPGFTPSTLAKIGTFGSDTFILKYSANGTPQWAKTIGGTGTTDRPVSMVLDSTGNLYLSGQYNSTTLNIPGFTPSTLAKSGTSTDTFILKYSANGTPQWAKTIGGTATDLPVSMVLDSTGNLYLSGHYGSSILNIPGFTPSTLARVGTSTDTFILKYLADGTPQWAKTIGGTGTDQPVSMVLDSTGNLYLSGHYTSTTLNIPGFTPSTLARVGGIDTFILKYLADGTPQWAKTIGGTGTDQPVSMVLDSTGNLYVSGHYASTTLNIPGFTPSTLARVGGIDTFILKYLADGTPQWAKSIGGTGTDQPVSMVLDSTGNLYLSGHYTSTTLDIPGFTPSTLARVGGIDTFILKYSANGTPQWAKTIGGIGTDQPVSMLLDSTGNLHLSGNYASTTLNIPGFTPSTLARVGTSGSDTFILKYSANGTPQWAKTIGGTGTDRPVSMVLDSTGNLYLSGHYGSSILNIPGFTPDILINNNDFTSADMFISKYSSNGTPQWAKYIGGTGTDRPVSMVWDSAGNLYVSGYYESTILNIPGFTPSTLARVGGIDTFILKYLADGTPQWAKSIGGTGTEQPVSMVLDSTGNLYVLGYYTSLTLNIPGFTPDTLTISGVIDTFILKYSANGTPQWAKTIGGTNTDQPVSMVLDSTGNLYVLGYYYSTSLNIPGFTPSTLARVGISESDIFILKYSADGTPQWAKSIGGSFSEQQPVSMVLDSAGNVYLSGYYFSDSLIIPGFTPSTLTKVGIEPSYGDIFILKYSANGTPQWAKTIGGDTMNFPVCMVLDSTGNVYLSGSYVTMLNIDNASTITSIIGFYKGFIIKYSTNGTLQLVKTIEGTSDLVPIYMISDSTGNLYISGFFIDTLIINDTLSLTPNYEDQVNNFIIKYSTNGTAQWAKSISGVAGFDTGKKIKMLSDSAGNLYAYGYFSNILIIDNIASLTSSGKNNIFILKYSANGTLQWAKSINGNLGEEPPLMVLDSTGNVYFSSAYYSYSIRLN